MWEPVGPLPASVYWRRRWVAALSVMVVVALVIWGVSTVVVPMAPARDGAPALAANRAALTAPQQVSSSPVPAPVAMPVAQPEGLVHKALLPEVPAPGTAGPTAAPTAAVPLPVPATGPVPCTNAMIAVAAEVDRPEYRLGEPPAFRLVIKNISGSPCVRDLDGKRQETVVWSNDLATRLWSSNDCIDPSTNDLRTLVPGQPVVVSVTWLGRTTTPGCATPRTVVPAGSYQVMTRLDDVISAPTPFRLAPSA